MWGSVFHAIRKMMTAIGVPDYKKTIRSANWCGKGEPGIYLRIDT
jgi:hypothetical protein